MPSTKEDVALEIENLKIEIEEAEREMLERRARLKALRKISDGLSELEQIEEGNIPPEEKDIGELIRQIDPQVPLPLPYPVHPQPLNPFDRWVQPRDPRRTPPTQPFVLPVRPNTTPHFPVNPPVQPIFDKYKKEPTPYEITY